MLLTCMNMILKKKTSKKFRFVFHNVIKLVSFFLRGSLDLHPIPLIIKKCKNNEVNCYQLTLARVIECIRELLKILIIHNCNI